MVEYIRNIEESKLPEMRRDLAEMEAGKLRIQSARQPGTWVDETPEMIRRTKVCIAEYEDIVEKLKAGKPPLRSTTNVTCPCGAVYEREMQKTQLRVQVLWP